MLTNMENVFGPKHHGGTDDPFETIKVLEAWLTPDEMIGFCKGQSIVYQRRHRMKNGLEDLAKSAWYQNYLVKYLAARGLSAYGETSIIPQKSEPKGEAPLPPDQQPVSPATGREEGGPPELNPGVEPSPVVSVEPGAGAAVADTASPGADIEADIAAMAAKLAPIPQGQAA